jgi:Tol biopolymer transport system component/DNA-binding winged helix-turn-helix (wHTH) protein
MSSTESGQTLRFGQFSVRPRSHTLKKNEIRIRLYGQSFEILLLLLDHPGDVVTREELKKKLWPGDTFVDFEHGLNAAIRNLRRALNDSPEHPQYIETVPRIGYRFIAEVGSVAVEIDQSVAEKDRGGYGASREARNSHRVMPELNAISGESERLTAAAGQDLLEFPARGPELSEAVSHHPAEIHRDQSNIVARHRLMSAALGAILLLAAFLARPVVPLPRVKGVHQITHIGSVVYNQGLLISGSRIYFMVEEKGENQIRYVSLDDHGVFPIEKPFAKIELHDVSPSGNELLIGEIAQGFPASEWRRTLWRLPVPDGAPRRVGNVFADDAAWSPDGRTIVYTNEPEQTLNLVDGEGGNARKLASLPGRPFKPRWSPDGKVIRTSVLDSKGGEISLWQLDPAGRNVGRLLPSWSSSSRAWTGRWTRDGRYFLFTGLQRGTRNIWALRDKKDLLRRNRAQPVQLTDGPLNFYLPVGSNDSKTIYAVGTQLHGQLMRYDARFRQFEPYANGLSADHLAFSRDGKWMAYVTYPEGELVRSRPDGSDRLQLTFAPMRAFGPQWSPDGSQIAFAATANPGTPLRIYLVSTNGSSPRSPVRGAEGQQGLPSWSPDGQSLLFARSDESGSEWALHAFNTKTETETVLPGTLGISAGTMSPDGRYIAGISASSGSLVLYEMASGATRQLAQVADYPCWSPHGKYVYYSTLMWGIVLGSEKATIYRVKVADGSIERVVPTVPFSLAGNWGIWSGLGPDGSILVLRELGTSDIYALDADLP